MANKPDLQDFNIDFKNSQPSPQMTVRRYMESQTENYWLTILMLQISGARLVRALKYVRHFDQYLFVQHVPFAVYIMVVTGLYFSRFSWKALALSWLSAVLLLIFVAVSRKRFRQSCHVIALSFILGLSYIALNICSICYFIGETAGDSDTAMLGAIWAALLFLTNSGFTLSQLCIVLFGLTVEFAVRFFTCNVRPLIYVKQRIAYLTSSYVARERRFNSLGMEFQSCTICGEQLEAEENVLVTKCRARHVFHSACIRKCLVAKTDCPICLEPLAFAA